ncbi:unnamed protein product [Rhizophagus irregularis]|nr:unnamed protein product [Rhizophagus irregularis]
MRLNTSFVADVARPRDFERTGTSRAPNSLFIFFNQKILELAFLYRQCNSVKSDRHSNIGTEECNEKQFQRKIDKYLRSLDTIVALEQEKRRTKAVFLIKRYRKASKFFFAGSIGGN